MNCQEFKDFCISSYESKIGKSRADFWNKTKKYNDECDKHLFEKFPLIKPLKYIGTKFDGEPFPGCAMTYDLCGFIFISVSGRLFSLDHPSAPCVEDEATFGEFLIWVKNQNYDI